MADVAWVLALPKLNQTGVDLTEAMKRNFRKDRNIRDLNGNKDNEETESKFKY